MLVVWLRTTINDSSFYSNSNLGARRIGGFFNLKDFTGDRVDQLQFDYLSPSDFHNRIRSPLEPYFWQEDFYAIEYSELSLEWYGTNLPMYDYNNYFTQNILNRFNIEYILENDIVLKDNYNENSTLFITLNEESYKLYSNERYSIWYIN